MSTLPPPPLRPSVDFLSPEETTSPGEPPIPWVTRQDVQDLRACLQKHHRLEPFSCFADQHRWGLRSLLQMDPVDRRSLLVACWANSCRSATMFRALEKVILYQLDTKIQSRIATPNEMQYAITSLTYALKDDDQSEWQTRFEEFLSHPDQRPLLGQALDSALQAALEKEPQGDLRVRMDYWDEQPLRWFSLISRHTIPLRDEECVVQRAREFMIQTMPYRSLQTLLALILNKRLLSASSDRIMAEWQRYKEWPQARVSELHRHLRLDDPAIRNLFFARVDDGTDRLLRVFLSQSKIPMAPNWGDTQLLGSSSRTTTTKTTDLTLAHASSPPLAFFSCLNSVHRRAFSWLHQSTRLQCHTWMVSSAGDLRLLPTLRCQTTLQGDYTVNVMEPEPLGCDQEHWIQLGCEQDVDSSEPRSLGLKLHSRNIQMAAYRSVLKLPDVLAHIVISYLVPDLTVPVAILDRGSHVVLCGPQQGRILDPQQQCIAVVQGHPIQDFVVLHRIPVVQIQNALWIVQAQTRVRQQGNLENLELFWTPPAGTTIEALTLSDPYDAILVLLSRPSPTSVSELNLSVLTQIVCIRPGWNALHLRLAMDARCSCPGDQISTWNETYEYLPFGYEFQHERTSQWKSSFREFKTLWRRHQAKLTPKQDKKKPATAQRVIQVSYRTKKRKPLVPSSWSSEDKSKKSRVCLVCSDECTCRVF